MITKKIHLKPTFIKKLKNASVLGLFETDVSTEQLLKSLDWTPSKLTQYYKLRSEKKKKEWLGVRLLLNVILEGQAFDLKYDDQGKPFLANPFYHISISHSGKYVCVLVNKSNKVGVDIQQFKANIEKGIALFMSEEELQDCSGKLNTEKLHVYWGAKEAIYKFYGLKKTNIKTDIYISPFEVGVSEKLEGRIRNKKDILLNYEITDQFVLVYTI